MQLASVEKQFVKETTAEIIEKMIELRKSKRITQTAIADNIGYDKGNFSRVESMKHIPNLDTMIKILVSMGYTLDIVPVEKKIGEGVIV